MATYNQAFDLYHTLYRFLHIISRFEGGTIEIDRLRIWDYYLLFPGEVYDIKLKKEESEIRRLRMRFLKKNANPYESVTNRRKVFERLRVYQYCALNCLVSYGIIDYTGLSQNRVIISNAEKFHRIMEIINPLSDTENNVLSLLMFLSTTSLYGVDGIKDRTGLIESKYDA